MDILDWLKHRFHFDTEGETATLSAGLTVKGDATLEALLALPLYTSVTRPDAATVGPNKLILYVDGGAVRKVLISDESGDWRVYATEGVVEP